MVARAALSIGPLSTFIAGTAGTAVGRRTVIIDQGSFGSRGSNLLSGWVVVQDLEVEMIGTTIESGDG
jgi:hypothetical protein